MAAAARFPGGGHDALVGGVSGSLAGRFKDVQKV
jgi:hypothetical protein